MSESSTTSPACPAATARRTQIPDGTILERAAPDACGLALEALRQALRREVGNVDLVLLTGGGARIYGDQARALFPGAVVHVAHDPVTANARGFFRHGR